MECAGDRPVRGVIELLDHLTAGYNVIVWSGGLECSRKIRERWLSLAHVRYTELILRPDNDRRDNVALKLDYLKRLLAQGFKPVLAIDDYPAVLEALSARGIKGLLVARDGVSSFRMKRSVGGDERGPRGGEVCNSKGGGGGGSECVVDCCGGEMNERRVDE